MRLRNLLAELRQIITDDSPEPGRWAKQRFFPKNPKEKPHAFDTMSTDDLVKWAMEKGDNAAAAFAMKRKDITKKDPKSKNGDTLLHKLAGSSDTNIMAWVADHDASGNLTNDDGETPVHILAKRHPDFARVDLVSRQKAGEKKDKSGKTAIGYIDKLNPGQADQYRRKIGKCPDDFHFKDGHCKPQTDRPN
jgi:hypothetical protein